VRYSAEFIEKCIAAYASGCFPMAEDPHKPFQWYRATRPAIMPLDERFHIPRSLRRVLNSGKFHTTWNRNFEGILTGCANRPQTWINGHLMDLYRDLHTTGWAHSFECWKNEDLAGGVLCITIGKALIGESMFTAIPEGGKVALVRLIEECRRLGITHFDCQIINPHTQRFGAYEITPEEHQLLLTRATRAKLDQNLPVNPQGAPIPRKI